MSSHSNIMTIYSTLVAGASILLFTSLSYMLTLIEHEYQPIIVSAGIPTIFVVIAMVYEYMMQILEAEAEADTDAVAEKKKNDDIEALQQEQEQEKEHKQLEGILYEVDMNDLIDMIVDKLQDKMYNKITTVNADDVREMLKAGYMAMSAETINSDIIEFIVDMVLSCIEVMSNASEAEASEGGDVVADDEGEGEGELEISDTEEEAEGSHADAEEEAAADFKPLVADLAASADFKPLVLPPTSPSLPEASSPPSPKSKED